MVDDTKNIGAIDFMRLFLASVLGAIAGSLFPRVNLYSPITQLFGIIWFFSASLLFYISYFYIPTIIVTIIPIPKTKRLKKLDKDTRTILLLLLTLLLIFIVFCLPNIFSTWFNS